MAKLVVPGVRISPEAQKNVLSYATGIMTAHKQFTQMHSKMEAIDIAYARYNGSGKGQDDGVDGGTACCNVLGDDNIIAPIVVSQVDSMVAYLADVYLSGSPLFPVVSTPKQKKWAEQLETLVDDHANLGGYARQILMFLRDGVKYNISAMEANWDSIEQFSVVNDFLAADNAGKSLNRTNKFYTALKRLDMYNVVWDYTVSPGDVSTKGDYAGYLEVLSATKLKTLLNKYTVEGTVYNVDQAFKSNSIGTGAMNYKVHPMVSDYITPRRPDNMVDWTAYITGAPTKVGWQSSSSNFQVFTFYARIMPSEFGISSPQKNTPQIWKFVVVNDSVVVHAKRIISAYDTLPILFGQPNEDGLGYQTQSTAEGEIPIQAAATTLFNIRFAAARRAVSDRALYNPAMIKPSDINAPVPAPKIPVVVNPLNPSSTLESAYKQIPFDMRGTESTIQDAAALVDFSKQLSGLNGPQQGQFQKGNKSVAEWNDTMGGSDNRLRLPALTLEFQVFARLKNMILLNIFQYGEDAIVVSQKTGETLNINIDELRQQVLAFRVADGYTPKSKIASLDAIKEGMMMITQMPALQAAYGPSLPSLFAHLMQLAGVRGLEEYAPEQASATPPQNLPGNTLQAPVTAPPIGTLPNPSPAGIVPDPTAPAPMDSNVLAAMMKHPTPPTVT